jgi:formate--tetrahydrofolate ligase
MTGLLRHIVIGLGGKANGIPREDGFNITPASEIMAISLYVYRYGRPEKRLGNIYIGSTLMANRFMPAT